MSFHCTEILFFGKVIPREGLQPDQKKLCMLMETPPIIKKDYNYFTYNKLSREVFNFNCRSM